MDIGPVLAGIRASDISAVTAALDRAPEALNKQDERHKLTPLFHALLLGDLGIIKFLLARGADAKIPNELGETPLHQAADEGSFLVIKELLAHGASANVSNASGETPLHSAVYRGDSAAADLLLTHGADPNLQTSTTGKTPLHLAVELENIECALLLLKYGGDMYIADHNKRTPLEISVENGADNELEKGHSNSLGVESGLKTVPEATASDEEASLIRYSSFALSVRSSSLIQQFTENRVALDEAEFIIEEEPDAENSLLNSSQYELYELLRKISLEKYYQVLANNDYASLDTVLHNIGSEDPLTIEKLKRLGVKEIGSAAAILLKIHQRAGKLPEYTIVYPVEELATTHFSVKCGGRRFPSFNFIMTIDAWLESHSLPQLLPLFTAAGYTSLDLLFLQMNSPFPLTEETLQHIGVESAGDRALLLSKLASDSRIFIGHEPVDLIGCSCLLV